MVRIRRFRIGDYDRLRELWREAKLPHKPAGRDRKESIAREIKSDNAVFLVAEEHGKMVGAIFGTHDGRKGWINRLAVDPQYRRQGLGVELVNEVERRLADLGIGIIACLIETWNKDSMRFFENSGYKRHDDIIYFTKRKDAEI
jgi:ribosomal protein S18 acetylase RimI-like enzyme